jgi:hypothetical protein
MTGIKINMKQTPREVNVTLFPPASFFVAAGAALSEVKVIVPPGLMPV